MKRQSIWGGIVVCVVPLLIVFAKCADDITPVVRVVDDVIPKRMLMKKTIKGTAKRMNSSTGEVENVEVNSLRQLQDATVAVGFWEQGTAKWITCGSGFFVADRLIATNIHVIAGYRKIAIQPYGKSTWHSVKSKAKYDRFSHLVLLETEEDLGNAFFHISEDRLQFLVTILGTQLSLPDTRTVKIKLGFDQVLMDLMKLVATSNNLELNRDKRAILDHYGLENWDAFSPGIQIVGSLPNLQSGAPIINNRGELIGVVVAGVPLFNLFPNYEKVKKSLLSYRSKSRLMDLSIDRVVNIMIPVDYLNRLLKEKSWVDLPITIFPE